MYGQYPLVSGPAQQVRESSNSNRAPRAFRRGPFEIRPEERGYVLDLGTADGLHIDGQSLLET
jgi:hypothetical protein